MISLTTFFWIMVILFGLVGMMRGWTREIIATSGIILALFTINQFGSAAFTFLGFDNSVITPPEDVRRQEFYILSAVLLAISFVSYQGPALAASRVGDRLRIRDSFQDKLLGFLAGGLNGYLIVGSIWSFLEYKLQSASNWVRYTPDVPYPFPTSIITRPPPELAEIIDNLPIPVLTQSPYILPLLLVVIFLFVLIVLL
jgi:uncharacterized membrane protein required for colicin V production